MAKIQPKTCQNSSKIAPKSVEIRFGGALGTSLLASCAQIATGRSVDCSLGDPLGEKGGPKGRVWTPRGPESGSQIDQLPLDGQFGPSKILSGSGSRNNIGVVTMFLCAGRSEVMM